MGRQPRPHHPLDLLQLAAPPCPSAPVRPLGGSTPCVDLWRRLLPPWCRWPLGAVPAVAGLCCGRGGAGMLPQLRHAWCNGCRACSGGGRVACECERVCCNTLCCPSGSRSAARTSIDAYACSARLRGARVDAGRGDSDGSVRRRRPPRRWTGRTVQSHNPPEIAGQ